MSAVGDSRKHTMRTALWWGVFAFCAAVFVFHFTAVQLANMPLSPLKLRLANQLDAYVNPFFTQRWNFFAPNPLDKDVFLLARGRYHPRNSSAVVETPWTEITKPLLGAITKHRWSPLFLVEIGLSNAVITFENAIADDPRAIETHDGHRYMKATLPATVDPLDMQYMSRTALATLEIANPGVQFDQVQLALVTQEYPRFTERLGNSPARRPSTTLVEWQPATWVAPYCCKSRIRKPQTFVR